MEPCKYAAGASAESANDGCVEELTISEMLDVLTHEFLSRQTRYICLVGQIFREVMTARKMKAIACVLGCNFSGYGETARHLG